MPPQCPGTQLQRDNQPERHGDLVHDKFDDFGVYDDDDGSDDDIDFGNAYDNDDAVVDDADLCLHGCQWFLQHRAGSPQSGGWLRARQSDPGKHVKVSLDRK